MACIKLKQKGIPMRVTLRLYTYTITLACLALLSCSSVADTDLEVFFVKIKKHYEATLAISAFSLNHHYLNKQYRDLDYWDYQTPNRIMAQRVVQVDLLNKHFYDNDIYYTSGGRLLDRVHFENDRQSFAYEMNGSSLGKRVINQGLGNFYRMDYILMDVDFIAVRPLLEEVNFEQNITLQQNKKLKTTTLVHKTAEDNVIWYEFNNHPLQLVSINNKSKRAIFVYDDYHTARGTTMARTVYQYYDGATEPNYIIYNHQFEIIEQVDAEKLRLPEGYGPEIPKSDGVLVSTEVAKNLYLVNDSGAWRNSLFKINGDEITIFGASGYPALAEKVLKHIHKQFPKKKIRSVYVTHPHGHDINGLNVFADRGIEILADEYTIAAIKAYPGFVNDITNFKFRLIEHDQVIDGVHFYVLENLHAKRQSFAYFKESEIIFQSHFLHVAFDNTIAKVIPNYTKAFIDFVRSKQLNVKRIVGNYLNNDISVEVMDKTYEATM